MQLLKNIVKKDNISVTKEMSINNAVEVMYSNHEGCVVILEDNRAVGIFTERDIISLLNKSTDMNQPISKIIKKEVISVNQERTLEYALHILIDNNIRRLVIVDNYGVFLGVITQEMIVVGLEEDIYKVNLKVSQVISSSQKRIVTIPSQSILKDTITLMHSNHIGSVLISENEEIVGIITERDIVRLVWNKVALSTLVMDVMSSPVLSVYSEDYVKSIVNMMHENGIRRVLVNDSDDKAIGIVGTRDIIKNIQGNYGRFIEKKLKYTKQALNTINEVIFELYIENDSMLIQWGNEVAVKRYGMVFFDKDITTLIDKVTWSEIIDILVKNGSIDDYKISIKDQKYLLSCIECNIDEKKKSFFIICKDVTDYELQLLSLNKNLEKRVKEEVEKNKYQEEQLFAQSRLAQMGEMIGMIAHQWRQPLASISAKSINLKIKSELKYFNLEEKEGAKEYEKYVNNSLEKINTYVNNLTTTIDDFRNFYKSNKQSVRIRVDEVILQSLNIIKTSLENDNIEIVEEYNLKDEVEMYQGEMIQVIMNILQNSQDNFREKKIENPYIKIRTNNRSISICDNGGGISKDIIDKIFDPYFSTKLEKNGTGLGLYMSKIIIEDHHNGKLSVENINDGVCFRVELGNISELK
ncbi:MAG: CBS domain-containing protein [Sulfurimonas sp.]|nr:CBS domain-containing protein [Sulfurimonas sp.]